MPILKVEAITEPGGPGVAFASSRRAAGGSWWARLIGIHSWRDEGAMWTAGEQVIS